MAGAPDVDAAQPADATGSGRSLSAAGEAIRRSFGTFRTASRNPDIARAVGAYGIYAFGEWATWIAMLVYAFDRGGPTASGIVALVQLLPSAALGPLLSGLAERWPRERVLFTALAGETAMMAVAAAALFVDASVPVVYAIAAVMTVFMTIGKPAHHALLPWL